MSVAAYTNPFARDKGVTGERIDQGVDFSAPPGSSLLSLGRGRIVHISSDFYEGQPSITEELLAGPLKGKDFYYAEQISPLVREGQYVGAGQLIATVAPKGTGLELGFGTPSGVPLAQSTGGYIEGDSTAAGVAANDVLHGLGAPQGVQQATTIGKLPPGYPTSSSGPGFLEQVGETLAAPFNALGEAPGDLAHAVVDDIVGWVQKPALEITLYGVFILGGMALILFGLYKALQPLKGKGRSATALRLPRPPGGRAGAESEAPAEAGAAAEAAAPAAVLA